MKQVVLLLTSRSDLSVMDNILQIMNDIGSSSDFYVLFNTEASIPEALQPCTFRILQQANDGIYEEGYCVKFRFWNRLPKDEYSYIYFGKVTVPISSFADITVDMIQGLNHINALKMEKTSLGEINVGETIIVAVPEEKSNRAYKDNGFDEPMKFAEEILGSNGGYTVIIDGINYRIFGELMIVNGDMFVYVE